MPNNYTTFTVPAEFYSEEEVARTLKVEVPTTLNALKSAFRRRSLLEHPDHSQHPKASERFQHLRAVFKFACKNYVELNDELAKTIEGTPLSSLGNGLGERKNGRPCDRCNAKGFHADPQLKPCRNCRPQPDRLLQYEYRCNRCDGSGEYHRNGVLKGKCFKCNGRGWKRGRAMGNRCHACKGSMVVESSSASTYRICRTCEGCGEIEIFNPVLPKGLLT